MPALGAPDWDQLLQQSEELAARDNKGIPQVQRDLHQVEQLSRNLRAKTARLDAGAETIAATRLLAHEGLNTRKLTRALQTFELRPTYEDVMPVESSSVQEYLDQMHEYTTIAAIQEAQRDTISAFEEYMDMCMLSDWAAEKKVLFDSALPDTALPGPAGQLAAASITAPYSPQQFRSTLPAGASSQAQYGPSHAQGLHGRVKSYAEALQKLNEADRSREKVSAVKAFASAAAADPDDGERRQTMTKLWGLLQSMVSGMPGPSASPAARTQALVQGARAYLAQGHADYLRSIVQGNRAQANLGGSPTRLDWTKAFLRVKEKDRGPLDFDVPGGGDTTWQRVYLCLRSGYDAEAIEEAKALKDAALQRGGSFSAVLADYLKSGGALPGPAAQAMAGEAERLLRAADRAAWARPAFRHKALLYVLLAGDRRVAEHLLRDAGSGLLGTIEDFMWYKLALVRPAPQDRQDGPSTSGYFSAGSGEAWAYTLSDLQSYLVQFPASHYSSGGREPLQYATVLLLSLQFRAAVAFLAQDATTKNYRVDAPHVAIALSHEQALDGGGEGDAGHSRGLDIASLVHRYGRSFVHSEPDVALEYYMRAAQLKGDTLEVKAQLLRELLTESNAFGYLIGSGGAGGAMERFVSSPTERGALVGGIAAECERAAQLDWAIELYLYAGQAGAALALINDQLSNALQPALSSSATDEEAEKLIRRGADAASRLETSAGSEDAAQRSAFNTLRLIRQLLQADRRDDFARVAQLLGQLDFIPADQFRVQRCLESVRMQPPAVADRVDAILAAGGRALSAMRQLGALRVLAGFAGSLPQRVSQSTFQQLNRLQSQLA
ncbi:g3750 [Coccomyxa viridis]|uniref:Nuclear pore protein n=1 Tax=Coccomyxa viridis TaxID=1274662 RepID=A0ABP1FNJ4_9CHLO